jgi:hypothetical protein
VRKILPLASGFLLLANGFLSLAAGFLARFAGGDKPRPYKID